MFSYYRRTCFGVLILGAALLSGCGLGANNTTVTIRIVDAVPSITALDFIVSGTTFVSNVSNRDVTTYGYVSNGSNTLVGVSTGTSNQIVPQQTATLNQNDVYTLVAAGVPGSATNPPTFFVFPDDNLLPPSGQIRIRFINASPGSGPVDVSLGSQMIASNVTYGAASTYAVASSGTNTISVVQTGTTSQIATLQPSQSLAVGHVFTLFLVGGTLSAMPTSIIAQEDV